MTANPELKIECELLHRANKYLITGLLFLYILLYILSRFLTPSYDKYKNQLFEGILRQNNLDEYIPSAFILQYILLLFSAAAFYKILTLTIRIKGTVIISENTIEVIKWKKFKFYFRIDQIKNIKVQFNYFKKNDTEPRNMVSGNNNVLEFSLYNKIFKYEFLLQTEAEDEIFRQILESWENKGVEFEYKTVLTDF